MIDDDDDDGDVIVVLRCSFNNNKRLLLFKLLWYLPFLLFVRLALSLLARSCRDDRGPAQRETTIFARCGHATTAMHDMSNPHPRPHDPRRNMNSITNSCYVVTALGSSFVLLFFNKIIKYVSCEFD